MLHFLEHSAINFPKFFSGCVITLKLSTRRRPMKKSRPPSMQFYFRQFAGDEHVMSMDLDAVGAHIILMCAAGASPEGYKIAAGSVPILCRDACRSDTESIPDGIPDEYQRNSADRKLRNLLRNPSDEDYLRIMSQLVSGPWKISPCGQWLVQEGMQRSIEKQKAFSELQSKRASNRWGSPDTGGVPDECRSDTESMPDGMPDGMRKTCSSSSTDIVPSTKVIGTSKKKTPLPPFSELPDKSPLWPGCKYLRMSESENKLAQSWYLKNNFPIELMEFAITEVETWLSGNTKGARDSRKNNSHYRQLYSEWVIDKALKLSEKTKRGSGGGGSGGGNIRNPTITERNQEYFNRKEKELKENDARTNPEIITVDGECLD